MGCQYFEPSPGGATTFTVAMPRLTFGRGALHDTGARAAALGIKRIALITDDMLATGPLVATVRESLKKSGIESIVFSDIRIEPDDDTVTRAASFLVETRACLLYTSPSPRDGLLSRMPSSA